LLALGLKKETADMCLHGTVDMSITQPFSNLVKIVSYPIIPAWSLHRLIEIAELPQYWECISGNWYEEVIATIQSEIHIGELNKEYLEE
jgi:hypothetical protein